MVKALQSVQSQDLNEFFVGHGSMKGDLLFIFRSPVQCVQKSTVVRVPP